MDAFETVVAMLLRREGYWITSSYKVDLTKEEKRAIGRFSSPRWEIDLLAYRGGTHELIAVECKSFLDSRGVLFNDGGLEPARTYKLFTDEKLREIVLEHLRIQLIATQSCSKETKVQLALATGKIAKTTNRAAMEVYFRRVIGFCLMTIGYRPNFAI